MSYVLKYYPDPGIAFDISKMLFVKLNSERTWQEHLVSLNTPDLDLSYIYSHQHLLVDPPPELLLFVYLPSNKSTTFLTTIIARLISQDFKNFVLPCLFSYLKNVKNLQIDLLSYYLGISNSFPNNIEELICHCKTIPDKIKLLLFSFILKPTKYVTKLIKTIHTYQEYISKLKENPGFHSLNITQFIDHLLTTSYKNKSTAIEYTNKYEIGFSMCFTTPDFLYHNLNIKNPYLISTSNTILQLLDNQNDLSINQLTQCSYALNDKNRIYILTHIIKATELTLAEISDIMNLSTSTTLHHLSALKKANLVVSSRRNRTVFYSYNPLGINNFINAFNQLEKGGYLQ